MWLAAARVHLAARSINPVGWLTAMRSKPISKFFQTDVRQATSPTMNSFFRARQRTAVAMPGADQP